MPVTLLVSYLLAAVLFADTPAPQPQPPLVEVVEAVPVTTSSPSALQSEAGISLRVFWDFFTLYLRQHRAGPSCFIAQ